jgi:hypothetical protein
VKGGHSRGWCYQSLCGRCARCHASGRGRPYAALSVAAAVSTGEAVPPSGSDLAREPLCQTGHVLSGSGRIASSQGKRPKRGAVAEADDSRRRGPLREPSAGTRSPTDNRQPRRSIGGFDGDDVAPGQPPRHCYAANAYAVGVDSDPSPDDAPCCLRTSLRNPSLDPWTPQGTSGTLDVNVPSRSGESGVSRSPNHAIREGTDGEDDLKVGRGARPLSDDENPLNEGPRRLHDTPDRRTIAGRRTSC